MATAYDLLVEIARLVLDYLNTLIWPVALLVLVIAGRSQISGLAAKLTGIEAGTGGISATFEQAAEQAESLRPGEGAAAVPVDRLVRVAPETYRDARELGDHLAAGTPVLLDLQDLPEADAKRFVDFSAGAVLISRGFIQRMDARQFLLVPGAPAPRPVADPAQN
ncbi:Protein of unknown function [Saccharopolyspora kobensis]|uniref:DUF552 domain-containing protein n=1 Tax=Saccharopolyspora kobensis TaxID=146035 RepID=A0A1H5TG25_9PSEU|nr:cell division protein SepF [Saccharopolyspora kobensis]SEF61690.1 Protein of unknown function [Saccharopolyspora kobensis]SFC46870.1 Protein of unknown function [Saccharopolyspora kobensis]